VQAKLWCAITAAAFLMSCGGDKKPARDPGDEPIGGEPALDDTGSGHGDVGEPDSDLPEFDEEAAKGVLVRSERKAQQCVAVVPDMPTGEGSVEVVFDGPKGRTVEVELGYPFSGGGDAAASCIKNAFLGEIIPPFKGGSRKVSHRFTLAEKTDTPSKP
jgi:hypothetical protein